jgi:hypothetical protein
MTTELESHFNAYGRWRKQACAAIQALRTWLLDSGIGDVQADLRLQHSLERLSEDRLTVAFVAEFSRGKSELINALFFSRYKDRILPSSTGRTTMCPTELLWKAGAQPLLRLLPIETRRRRESLAGLKEASDLWVEVPLEIKSAPRLQHALMKVSETRMADQEEAVELGFAIDSEGIRGLKPNPDGQVEIPCWRHALIFFPHPLLEQGLVVLDTPGLNAIGAEPELTLSLLPNAHSILFVLGIDTGVTQSDLTVWRDYVKAGTALRRGRLVVLNKIDSLWDGLREERRIEEEITRQVKNVAGMLDVPTGHVFPVSAQKALLARVNKDQTLLAKSRIGPLEEALTLDLLPAKQEIVRENLLSDIGEIVDQASELIQARLAGIQEQLTELTELRGKNQGVIEYMMRKIRTEKEEFERGLQKFYAVRTVFTDMTNKLLSHLGLDALRDETRRTREAMLDSSFSRGLQEAMEGFFSHLRTNLDRSSDEVTEITRMLEAMYKRFSVEHGLKLPPPATFSTLQYEQEVKRLEQAFNSQLNTAFTLLTTEKKTLTQKFFETVALEARKTFELANRDVEHWLRAVMSPLETQVREYQLQLKRRLDSVKRIHQATDTLEDRIEELRVAQKTQQAQLQELVTLETELRTALCTDCTSL